MSVSKEKKICRWQPAGQDMNEMKFPAKAIQLKE
jgi:hypothetical protein